MSSYTIIRLYTFPGHSRDSNTFGPVTNCLKNHFDLVNLLELCVLTSNENFRIPILNLVTLCDSDSNF